MSTGLTWIREDGPRWDADKLNYIYNVVPATSPDPAWITAWLLARGFVAGGGDLRRRVRERTAD